MDVGEGASTSAGSSQQTIIQPGHNVLIRLPSGDIRSVKLDKDSCVLSPHCCLPRAYILCSTIHLGKFGSFFSNDLISQPYGLTYDIVNKTLKVVPPRAIQEVGRRPLHFSGHSIDDGRRGYGGDE